LHARFTNDEAKKRIEIVGKLMKLAADLDTNVTLLSLAWCLANSNVSTVILGASKVAQLEENLKAIEVLPKLTADVLEQIELIVENKPRILTF
jgi:aryl-alcohol dehydrogenase-like predicted oxidoreductase